MKSVFICGTDTGVGKTVVTGLIARQLLWSKGKRVKGYEGQKVITQKWVQTGCKGFPKDIAVHLKLMGKPQSYVKDILHLVNPYCFEYPASPHLAAKMIGSRQSVVGSRIKHAFKELTKRFDHVIVEGTGGALVPFNDKLLQLDLVKELKLPVILVVGNKLGAINHALLTIEAIRTRRIRLLGLIFNDMKGNSKVLKDNMKIIAKLSGLKAMASLGRSSKVPDLLWADARG